MHSSRLVFWLDLWADGFSGVFKFNFNFLIASKYSIWSNSYHDHMTGSVFAPYYCFTYGCLWVWRVWRNCGFHVIFWLDDFSELLMVYFHGVTVNHLSLGLPLQWARLLLYSYWFYFWLAICCCPFGSPLAMQTIVIFWFILFPCTLVTLSQQPPMKQRYEYTHAMRCTHS